MGDPSRLAPRLLCPVQVVSETMVVALEVAKEALKEHEALQMQRVSLYRSTVISALTTFTLDTSHVPCKFFKVGQCQAGKACPFSHSTDSSKFEQPCKYFSKVSSLLLPWQSRHSRRSPHG